MITISNYYKGRDKQYPYDLSDNVRVNAEKLLIKVNELLTRFGQDRAVTSGWRPYSLQMEINPRAPNSKHITGDAIDLEDKDGKLKEWCVFNLHHLEELGLWLEHPSATPTWVHLQQKPPNSGKRIFQP